jgi:hypothetical protein
MKNLKILKRLFISYIVYEEKGRKVRRGWRE